MYYPATIISLSFFSLFLTTIVAISPALMKEWEEFLDFILNETQVQHVMLPILLQIILSVIYLFFLFLGALVVYIHHNRRKETKTEARARTPITVSLSKFLGVSSISFLFMVVGVSCILFKSERSYFVFICIQLFIWVTSICFEFISIGHKIQILYGEKPRAFGNIESFFERMQRLTLNKIEKMFFKEKKEEK